MKKFEIGKKYFSKVFYDDFGMEIEEYAVTSRTEKTITFHSDLLGDKKVKVTTICDGEIEFARIDKITKISAENLVA